MTGSQSVAGRGAGEGVLVLGVDTCGPSGTVALARVGAGGIELLGQTELAGKTYSATLVSAVEGLLTGHGVKLADIGAIVVVNGPAIGAGSELVGFGDVVIATPKAKFAQPEVKLGVFPPFAAVMLPQIIGQKKTYELILTGEALTAEDALRFGFVNKVVSEAELPNYVESLMARISEFSGPVLEVTKRVIGNSIGQPLKQAMKTSQDLYLNELMSLEDVQEGLRAVIEKRKPVWKNK